MTVQNVKIVRSQKILNFTLSFFILIFDFSIILTGYTAHNKAFLVPLPQALLFSALSRQDRRRRVPLSAEAGFYTYRVFRQSVLSQFLWVLVCSLMPEVLLFCQVFHKRRTAVQRKTSWTLCWTS